MHFHDSAAYIIAINSLLKTFISGRIAQCDMSIFFIENTVI
jgi:hypothetical protein